MIRFKLRSETSSGCTKVHSVSRICAHSSVVYVTYTIDKCEHMRETKRISSVSFWLCSRLVLFSTVSSGCHVVLATGLENRSLFNEYCVDVIPHTRWLFVVRIVIWHFIVILFVGFSLFCVLLSSQFYIIGFVNPTNNNL